MPHSGPFESPHKLRSPTRRVTSKGPCHLASNLELEVGSNTCTYLPVQNCVIWSPDCTAGSACPGPVTNSPWRAAPRCGVLFSGPAHAEFHFCFPKVPPPTSSLKTSNTPRGWHPYRSSKGENPVEACGTSRTANKRGSSHLSQFLPSSCKNFRIIVFNVRLNRSTRPSVCGW